MNCELSIPPSAHLKHERVLHETKKTPKQDLSYLGLNGLHLGGALQLRVGQRIGEDLEEESKENDRQAK